MSSVRNRIVDGVELRLSLPYPSLDLVTEHLNVGVSLLDVFLDPGRGGHARCRALAYVRYFNCFIIDAWGPPHLVAALALASFI